MNSPILPNDSTKRFNWSKWYKRLSTLNASVIAVLGSVLVYYNQLEPFQKAEWPWWVPLTITMAIPALTTLFPIATSFKQKNLS